MSIFWGQKYVPKKFTLVFVFVVDLRHKGFYFTDVLQERKDAEAFYSSSPLRASLHWKSGFRKGLCPLQPHF
jgi:hypothetical protein